ncbi:hypothetical protein NR798_08530 [Archangium gephyra]|uniref:hypothetical protein n=1 Tax=Archangium gephyra TaxID=48 RepID=UPI0035D512BF
MPLREWMWRLVALSAVGMGLAACTPGDSSLACSGPDDCLESEVCHPDDRVCVQLCTTRADCPPKALSCDALSGAEPQRVCKCPTKECVGDRVP